MQVILKSRLGVTVLLGFSAAIAPWQPVWSQAAGSQVAAQPSPPQAAQAISSTAPAPTAAEVEVRNAHSLPPATPGTDQDIVISGFRSSLASALTEKKAETASVDTIKAEDIGKFPDSNLAESMQRLPGVSLSRGDGGEVLESDS